MLILGHLYYPTSIPMLLAVPAIILQAESRSAAFKSTIFCLAISSSCFRVTLPTLSRFGSPAPLAIFAAFFNRTDAGGVLVLIVSFYTYDSEGNQVYLIASGLANTGMTAVVDITISGGRTWGDDQPGEYTTSFGTGTFTFPSCTTASFTITPNAEYQALGFTELSYDLTHDLLTSQIACPTFVNNAN